MVERSFEDLVRDLADRRRLSETPPVLLLGAGASIAAGVGMMGKLYEFVGVKDFDGFVAYIVTRDENERYRLLAEFLQTQDPREVTPGYSALAELCAAAVFDVVLTTNLDPLLDDALAAARLRRRDYLTFINGVARSERLALLLRSRSPRVKLVKLHGDLFHRFMAWTPPEMEAYLRDVAPILGNVLGGRDVMVVGYSLRDDAVRDFVMGLGGAVWYVNPSPPPDALKNAANLRAVVRKDLTFEVLFSKLRAALGLGDAAPLAPPALARGPSRTPAGGAAPAAPEPAATTDDLVAAVVGLAAGPNDPPHMTGFLLAAPRVIVTDGWAGNQIWPADGSLFVVTADGRRLPSRIRPSRSPHPFGPALVDAPAELHGPGLGLDTSPMARGARLQMAVAAGERVGLAAGLVSSGREQELEIQPVGRTGQLVHVQGAVAPGSSGAPAVDDDMRVRGFVVAGSVDPDHPDTFILPAARWAAALTPRATPVARPPAVRKKAPAAKRRRAS